jgi:hypothetical protein
MFTEHFVVLNIDVTRNATALHLNKTRHVTKETTGFRKRGVSMKKGYVLTDFNKNWNWF